MQSREQLANRPRVGVAGQNLRLLQIGDEALAAVVVLRAVLRQRDAARRAVKQAEGDVTLKRCDDFGKNGRADIQVVRSRDERFRLRNAAEELDRAQLVHVRSRFFLPDGRHGYCSQNGNNQVPDTVFVRISGKLSYSLKIRRS